MNDRLDRGSRRQWEEQEPWGPGFLPSLSLSFLICEVGIMTSCQAAVSDREENVSHVPDTGPGAARVASRPVLGPPAVASMSFREFVSLLL